MLNKAIAATTHLDKHNSRITKEALEKAAFDINHGNFSPKIMLNHDKTIIPFGKIIEADISKMTDGEYKLEIVQEIFEEENKYIFEDETEYIESLSSFDKRPFTELKKENLQTSVSLDEVNFENKKDFEDMLNLIEKYNISSGLIVRKSHIPDPELLIKIGNSIAGIILGKKVLDSIGDKLLNNILDEVDNFYEMTKTVIVKYSKMAIPRNRPQTYIFSTEENYMLELIIKTSSPEEVLESIKKEKLESIHKKIEDLERHFSINSIQFIYLNNNWIFNYLCTTEGSVIGTKETYNRRSKAFELFKEEKKKLDNIKNQNT